jgi:ubiquilin
MGETITVKVRPSNGILFDVEFDPECTVFQLKEKVGEKMAGASATLLKLVYSGRILKDEDICNTYSKWKRFGWGRQKGNPFMVPTCFD